MFSMQFAIATEMLSSTLTRLGSQPITFSKLPGKFIISRITSLGSTVVVVAAQIEWKNFTFYARDLNSTHWWGGLNDSIIIQDRFHLLCWSKMMHRAELIFSLVFLKDWKEVLGFVVQALIEVNSIAINCLVIKLAGHSELTTKTDSVVIFSHSNRSSSLESSCQKRFFLWLLQSSYCQHLFFQSMFTTIWIFQEIKSDILKNVWSWGKKVGNAKYLLSIVVLVIRYLHIIRWHALSALRKKKFQRTSRVSSKPNETILIFATEQRWWWPFASLVRIIVVAIPPQKSH